MLSSFFSVDVAGTLRVICKGTVELKRTRRLNLRYLNVFIILFSLFAPSSLYASLFSNPRRSLIRKADSLKVKAYVIAFLVFIRVVSLSLL